MSQTGDIIRSRGWMAKCENPYSTRQMEAEGGFGVVGLASTVALPVRHFFESLRQMHNRGNGKGGGIAAVGLDPKQMRVSKEVLENDYLKIQVIPELGGVVYRCVYKPAGADLFFLEG